MNAVDKFLLKWGVALVALIGAVALAGYGCGRAYGGKLRERAQRQEETLKQQTKRADSIRTVYVHDTVPAYRYLTEWDRVTDTLRLSDTVAIAQAAPRLLLKADSTIRACARALHDCDALQQAERERADSALALAETYKKLDRGPFVQFYGEALHDLAGGTTIGAGAILGTRMALTVRGEADLSGGPIRAYVGLRVRF
jgi:hypothetical protein